MIPELFGRFAAACGRPAGFFGLPKWYEYLRTQDVTNASTGQVSCQPIISGIGDVWLILAAVLDIMLRLAVLLAVGFVVWGGIQYIKSRGEPDRLTKARQTIIYALVGMVLAIMANILVSFAAGRFN